MIRLLASLLIALGLAFAPAMMARVSAMPAPAMDHCKGAMPSGHAGKADAKPCCTTACPATAALPILPATGWTMAMAAVPAPLRVAVFSGFDPERETPPPRVLG